MSKQHAEQNAEIPNSGEKQRLNEYLSQDRAEYVDGCARMFFDPDTKTLKIDIESAGCANACAGVNCRYCYNDLEELQRDDPVEPEELDNALNKIISSLAGDVGNDITDADRYEMGMQELNSHPDIQRIIIGSHGDPLDEEEVKRETLELLMKKMSKVEGKQICFETHAKNFFGKNGDSLIDTIHGYFPEGGTIEMGLETVDEKIRREHCAPHKGYSIDKYQEAVEKIYKRGLNVDSHVFVGIPGLGAKEQIDAAVDTIGWLNEHTIKDNNKNDANKMVLFVYNDKETTTAHEAGVPGVSAWMLPEVLRRAAEEYGPDVLEHMSFAWYGNRKADRYMTDELDNYIDQNGDKYTLVQKGQLVDTYTDAAGGVYKVRRDESGPFKGAIRNESGGMTGNSLVISDGYDSVPPVTCEKCYDSVGGRKTKLGTSVKNEGDFYYQLLNEAKTGDEKYQVIMDHINNCPCGCYAKMMDDYEHPGENDYDKMAEHAQKHMDAEWERKKSTKDIGIVMHLNRPSNLFRSPKYLKKSRKKAA